jgi:MFS family permease
MGRRIQSPRRRSVPSAEAPQQQLAGTWQGDDDEELLLTWWLFVLPLYWFSQGINFSVIQGCLMPFQIEAVVDNRGKYTALSLMTVAGNIGSMTGPIWGTLSDKLVDKDGRRVRRT